MNQAVVDTSTVYDQWTKFPFGFDPIVAGLTFEATNPGDLDASGTLDVTDLDLLANLIRGRSAPSAYSRLGIAFFDMNSDSVVDQQDQYVWVKDLKRTWFGDANLDMEFNSNDLVSVLAAGEYEDSIAGNSSWATGDWDGDGDATSSDLITALADGGYEQGPRAVANAVPEPASFLILMVGLLGVASCRRHVGP